MEFDSNERKQNYEQETHSFVASVKTTDSFNFHFDKSLEPLFTYNVFTSPRNLPLQPFEVCILKEPSPPDKIYLRQHSLLIWFWDCISLSGHGIETSLQFTLIKFLNGNAENTLIIRIPDFCYCIVSSKYF